MRTKLSQPGAAEARYANVVVDTGEPLREHAKEMHTYLEVCAGQSERYIQGESMASMAAADYQSSSRATAFGWLSTNIRTTAYGIAGISRSMFRGSLLSSVIEAWRTEDPDTLPAVLASNSDETPQPLPLEHFNGQLPREYTKAYAGTITLAWMVEVSPFTSSRRQQDEEPEAGQTTGRHQIPARPGTSGMTEQQIYAARDERIAAMKRRAMRFTRPPRPRPRRPGGGDAAST